jgi:hypothetical protein
MVIKFKDILRSASESNREWLGDTDNVAGVINEAEECKSWEFFEIEVDYNAQEIIVPDNFNAEETLQVICCYLDIVEGNDTDDYASDIVAKAQAYDEFTVNYRGADDGTYDYAGTYVISILEAVNNYMKQ